MKQNKKNTIDTLDTILDYKNKQLNNTKQQVETNSLNMANPSIINKDADKLDKITREVNMLNDCKEIMKDPNNKDLTLNEVCTIVEDELKEMLDDANEVQSSQGIEFVKDIKAISRLKAIDISNLSNLDSAESSSAEKEEVASSKDNNDDDDFMGSSSFDID